MSALFKNKLQMWLSLDCKLSEEIRLHERLFGKWLVKMRKCLAVINYSNEASIGHSIRPFVSLSSVCLSVCLSVTLTIFLKTA